jgi:CPA2 family monovalent cation:H+ antiporter-2
MRVVRGEQYRLLRGLFQGANDRMDESPVRLHSVTLDARASALGKSLSGLDLDALGVQVMAVRRPGAKRKKLSAEEAGALEPGDVVVLLGAPEELGAAEHRLLRG